jgi:hypothetical protein
MATSASQTYISKLGFQDRDRSNERHGLACEYLFERMMDLEVSPWIDENLNQLQVAHYCDDLKVGNCINSPIKGRNSFINGFADVLIKLDASYRGHCWLGEVKITKEPAENVLQQINFYLAHLKEDIEAVYVLTDYDPGDLKRLCAGTKIKVYRLGQVFEQWLEGRTTPETEEL